MTGGSRLRIRVLGRLDAWDGDVEVDLGGRRQRAVLAVLVLARGQAVPAERIADCLWGESLPANAAGAVQSYVSHLRRRLQPDGAPRSRGGVIVNEGGGYAVRLPRDGVDAWRFERLVRDAGAASSAGDPRQAAVLLTEALDLWRGPALSEYAGESWAEAEIARLSELRGVARERLLAARLEAGESALLVPELEALVAEEPLREERWRLLVLALYRAQRQADALAALRRARALLADELGIDPGPALRALEGEVLAQSPALGGPVPEPAPPPAVERTTPPSPAPSPRRRRPTWSTATARSRRSGPRSPTFMAGPPSSWSSRARPGSARPGCLPRRGAWRRNADCPCSAPGEASSSGHSASAPCGSCSSRCSSTPSGASGCSPALPGARGASSTCPTSPPKARSRCCTGCTG